MNEKVRLAGIIGIIAALIVMVLFRPDMVEAEIGKTLVLILIALIGVPIGTKAVKRRLAKARGEDPDKDDGLKWTWDEWHAFVSGLGDGLSLGDGDMVPESFDQPKESTYWDILKREAWYYKVGLGVGRILWVPTTMAAIMAIMRLAGSIFG